MMFTLLILLCLGIFMMVDYRRVFTRESDNLNILKLNSLILYYDEVMTTAVQLAVFTNDITWENRYRETEPKINKAIKDIFLIESDQLIQEYVSETELAYKNLIKMDHEVFEYIRNGQTEEALVLYNSDVYQNQKDINSARIDQTLQKMRRITHAYQSKHNYLLYTISIGILISIPGLMLIWIGILRIIKDHIDKRNKAELELQIANEELEQRVAERTSELTKINESLIYEIESRKKAELKAQKLAHAAEQSPNMVIITDTKGNIEYVNPRFTEVTGYTQVEASGKNPRILKSGETEQKEYMELWETITSGGIWRGEFHNKKKNGDLYWGSTSISGIRNENGNISHFVGVQEDINDRKKMEIEIKQKTLELGERVKELNSLYEISKRAESAELSLGDLLTSCLDIIRSGWMYPEITCVRIKHEETEYKTDNFADTEWSMSSEIIIGARVVGSIEVIYLEEMPENEEGPFLREERHLIDVISIRLSKIIENALIKEELIKAKEEAEAGNRAKSSFLANMSHEIRTPMNAILGFTELLTEQVEDSKQLEYLSVVSSSGKSLLRIINDILDLSKIEAGMLDIQFNTVNPHQLFKEIKQMFSWKSKEKNLDFILEVDPALPEGLLLDEVRIRQVIVNLVGNAIKFTHHGHIKLQVKQKVNPENTSKLSLTFSVEDTGIGIPAEQLNSIFEAFRQQEDQSTAEYGGTGLGLAISKRLIEMMGGRFSVESEVERGSSFQVELTDVAVASFSDTEDDYPLMDFDTIRFEFPTILAVDDQETNRFLLREYLQTSDVILIEGSNGIEAVELTESHNPDLILMDIKMPVMDGREAARKILSNFSDRKIPIIALTASVMSSDLEKICEIGFTGYLRKPTSKKRLLSEIMKHLPFHNLTDEKVETESDSNDQMILEDLSEETIAQLSELKRILENDHKDTCQKLQNTLIINEAKEFAAQLSALGQDFQFKHLNDWANDLILSIDTFNISGISEKLDKFPSLISMIDSLLDKSS